MIVAMSRRIAVDLYNQIIQLRPQWHNDDLSEGAIKVVMTASSADCPVMQKHHTTKSQRRDLSNRMKDPEDPLRLVIVIDMWLTGFDVPCLHTLYVDKKDLSSELVLGDIAKSAGLGEDFSAALKRGDAKDEAEANIRLAESFQVDETPTIIINGNLKVTPALTNEDMVAMAGNLDAIVASLLS